MTRRRLEVVLQSVSDGVLGIDANGIIHFINPSGARLLGYPADEIVGKPLIETVHRARPDGSPYAAEESPIYATIQDGTVHHVRGGEVFWRKDGKTLPVEFVSSPVRKPNAKSNDVMVVFRPEGTGAKRDRESFGVEAAKLVELYERTTDAFFALDKDWRIVYLNPVAQAMVPPQNRARRIGEQLWDTFPDLKGTKFDTEYHRAMAEQVNVHVEEYFARYGRWFAADAFATPEGLSIFFRDITAKKQVEEANRATTISRPLVRRIVQDLVEAGGVAHQILQQVGRKIASETEGRDLDDYARAYAAMGLGSLRIEKREEGRFAFLGHDLLEHRPGSRVATCYFTLGFLSEAVSKVSRGEPTLGTEIECQSRGSHECRFIVQVKKPEEGLARRVKELV